ncbi:MAG TPA: hypothetical protein VGG54_22965 [Trebonia sp.]|jgi:hypothetical protein
MTLKGSFQGSFQLKQARAPVLRLLLPALAAALACWLAMALAWLLAVIVGAFGLAIVGGSLWLRHWSRRAEAGFAASQLANPVRPAITASAQPAPMIVNHYHGPVTVHVGPGSDPSAFGAVRPLAITTETEE